MVFAELNDYFMAVVSRISCSGVQIDGKRCGGAE